ncbi:MAG: hypothetical protein LLG04_16745 [Parachlamydia sp.]|nr:hypothetical protein [Parachlamydia sp.]
MKQRLERIENDPLFEQFIDLLYEDGLANPSKLKDVKDDWDSDWDKLLKGVEDED